MFEVIIGSLLGGFLAIAGGFLAQYYQNYITNSTREFSILRQINILMLELSPIYHDSKNTKTLEVIKTEEALIEKALQLTSKKNRLIALLISGFVFNDFQKNYESLSKILQIVQLSINKGMINDYQKIIDNNVIKIDYQTIENLKNSIICVYNIGKDASISSTQIKEKLKKIQNAKDYWDFGIDSCVVWNSAVKINILEEEIKSIFSEINGRYHVILFFINKGIRKTISK